MAQRVRLPKAERRRRLLAAASEMFGKKGYRRTEMADVARAAGVTKPVLYRHFPGGKAEIFIAVLDQHLNALLRDLWAAMAGSTEPRERVYRGLDAYVAFAERDPRAFRLLVDSPVEIEADVAEQLHRARELIADGLTNTIGDVMRGVGLGAEGAPIYAHALLGAAESSVSWWLEKGVMERAALVDHLLAFIWRGFDGLPRDPSHFRALRGVT